MRQQAPPFLHPVIKTGNFCRRHSQAQFRAPPNHVIGALSEFIFHQPQDFAFCQVGPEILAQIGISLRVAQTSNVPPCRMPAPDGAPIWDPEMCNRASDRPSSGNTPSTGKSPPGKATPAVHGAACVKNGTDLFQRAFGKAAVGRDFAAENIHRWRAAALIQLERIVAGRCGGAGCPVIIKRAHTRIGPDDVIGERLFEVFVDEIHQILLFLRRADRFPSGSWCSCIRGANQREIGLVGNGKDNPPICPLEEIAFVMIIKLRSRYGCPAPDGHHRSGCSDRAAHDVAHPRAACVDDHARRTRVVSDPCWSSLTSLSSHHQCSARCTFGAAH